MLKWLRVIPDDAVGIAAAREMFEEYQRELGIDLCFQGFQDELETLPGHYGPPSGCLYLVHFNSELAACGALRQLEPGVCELKRIYVRPAFRRMGIALKLSMSLMTFGIENGFKVCRLDTLRRLEGAVEMYAAMGFKEIEPYNHNPELDIVYMERAL